MELKSLKYTEYHKPAPLQKKIPRQKGALK